MKNKSKKNENINTMARISMGVIGTAMLVTFYSVASGGGALGSGVYLAILSIVPITMSITDWSLVSKDQQNQNNSTVVRSF